MAILYKTSQFFITTLNVGGGIDNSQTTGITIADDSGIADTSAPGIALVNYADPLNTSTAEWITFTSISSKVLQGVTRGAEGFSAKAHDNSVQVAFPLSKSHINNIVDKLNGADTIDADLDIGSGYVVQYNGSDPRRIITLTPGFIKPTTTSGCSNPTQVEAGTNDIDYDVLDFDASSDENAYCNFQMPDSYDGGVIQFRYIWTNASGLTTETVVFELSGRAFANDDAIDQAVGTPIEVSDTWIAQGDIHVSAWSGDVTLAGSPAGGQWVHLEIMRDVSEDNLTGDARLIAVQIRYKQATQGE